MSFTDWVIDLALIGLVVVQLRGRPLTVRSLLLPVVLVSWAGATYLRDIPTGGNDLLLIVPAALVGLALGTGAGTLTKVHRGAGGAIIARATIAAAVLWVLGMGCRLAFQLFATHGGGEALGRFSASHRISVDAWAPALILMAFAEVLARTGIVWWRGQAVRRAAEQQRVASA
ncbi:hypothetical protein [Streptomyces sp. NPDC002491]